MVMYISHLICSDSIYFGRTWFAFIVWIDALKKITYTLKNYLLKVQFWVQILNTTQNDDQNKYFIMLGENEKNPILHRLSCWPYFYVSMSSQWSFVQTWVASEIWLQILIYRVYLYSFRISATLSCPMLLQKYPLDTQTCPMMFESCKCHGFSRANPVMS